MSRLFSKQRTSLFVLIKPNAGHSFKDLVKQRRTLLGQNASGLRRANACACLDDVLGK
jgi:hypothetical protein